MTSAHPLWYIDVFETLTVEGLDIAALPFKLNNAPSDLINI